MKRLKYLVFSLILVLPVLSLNAMAINNSEISGGTYIIGTHMFTREVNSETGYEGKLTTPLIMRASKTLEGNNIEDMVILYKNPRGVWVNAMNGEMLNVPTTFEITNKNKEEVKEEINYETHTGTFQLRLSDRKMSYGLNKDGINYVSQNEIKTISLNYMETISELTEYISFDLITGSNISLFSTYGSSSGTKIIKDGNHVTIKFDLQTSSNSVIPHDISIAEIGINSEEENSLQLKNIVIKTRNGKYYRRDDETYNIALDNSYIPDIAITGGVMKWNEGNAAYIISSSSIGDATGYEVERNVDGVSSFYTIDLSEHDASADILNLTNNSVYAADCGVNNEYTKITYKIRLFKYNDETHTRSYGNWSNTITIEPFDIDKYPIPLLNVKEMKQYSSQESKEVVLELKNLESGVIVSGIEILSSVGACKGDYCVEKDGGLYEDVVYKGGQKKLFVDVMPIEGKSYIARYYYKTNEVIYYGEWSAPISTADLPATEYIAYGDVDNDGKITEEDAILLLYYTLLPEEYPLTEQGLKNADVNADGYITSDDAVTIKLFLDGLQTNGFLPLTPITEYIAYGDVNVDGKITEEDATLLLYYTLLPEEYPLTEQGIKNADVDGDGNITSDDAIVIKLFLEGVYPDLQLPYRILTNLVSYGDVNEDAVVDISDVTVLKQFLGGYEKLNPRELKNADVNADGFINDIDVQLLQQYLVNAYPKYNLPREPLKGNVYRIEFNDLDKAVFGLEGYKVSSKTISREGYTFLGWFEEGAEESYDFTQGLTRNVKLYAKFQEN